MNAPRAGPQRPSRTSIDFEPISDRPDRPSRGTAGPAVGGDLRRRGGPGPAGRSSWAWNTPGSRSTTPTRITGTCRRPLLFALHLAGQTREIRLGTAIICLNLHHPLDVAEQVAVADVLTKGRMAVGFGSGSTPEEFGLFGLPETDDDERHARFAEALRIIRSAWSGRGNGDRRVRPRYFQDPAAPPAAGAGGGPGAALLGRGQQPGLGADRRDAQFQHALLPPADAGAVPGISRAYRAAGGTGLIAANRPVFVGPDDETAFALAEPALRILWRRFRQEGQDSRRDPRAGTDRRTSAAIRSTSSSADPSRSRGSFARFTSRCRSTSPTSRCAGPGSSHELVRDSLRRLMENVLPLVLTNGLAHR